MEYSGALFPKAHQESAGRGRQGFPTADRHPGCPLLPPTVSHDSGDAAPGTGEIPKPLKHEIIDRTDVMLSFSSLPEPNPARSTAWGDVRMRGQDRALRMGHKGMRPQTSDGVSMLWEPGLHRDTETGNFCILPATASIWLHISFSINFYIAINAP